MCGVQANTEKVIFHPYGYPRVHDGKNQGRKDYPVIVFKSGTRYHQISFEDITHIESAGQILPIGKVYRDSFLKAIKR